MFKRVRGFTIVEMLIVIIIIAILTTITAVGIIRYQAASRDAERAAKTTVIAEALEKYYDKNGEYPSCPVITDVGTTVTTTTLPGMDPQSLLTPTSADSDTNSIKCVDLTGAAGEADVFAYVGDGSDACKTGASCLKWTLEYKDELSNTIKSVNSRRNTDIATSNSAALSVSATGFTTGSATWGVVQNALSYEVERATDTNFTANLQTYTAPANVSPSVAITGLSYNTKYYFHVRAITTDSQGLWSNSTNMTTWVLTQPTLTATAQSFTQINTTWGAISHATSYEVQRATDAGFTANLSTQTSPGGGSNFLSLSYDTAYYFRVRAIATTSPVAGAWSATVSAPTWRLITPSMSAATASSTSFRATWNAISHAASYTVQCSSNGTTWNSGCSADTTATTFLFSGAAQGYQYYTRVQAVNGSYTSGWSNIAGAVTSIDSPAAFPLYSSNTLPNWNYLNVASGATCPAGTSMTSDWYANGSYWTSGGAPSYGLGWNTGVTISVASRCYTGATTSGWVWANNTASMSLPIPTVSISLPGNSVMYWSGTCPKWATSSYYWFDTNGRINASGNTQATSYGPAGPWGNGRAHVIISCDGPWGTYQVEGVSTYGPGCVPTPTVAECYQ
ncbi:MAG: fibronectin type III domain-containing protein [Candidatus Saccharimonadaceae bacterium]